MEECTCSVIGGVEGGATNTHVVLIDKDGKILVKFSENTGTNHHLIGMPGCRDRIVNLINKAKNEAKIPLETPLKALGLSISGFEKDASNEEFVDMLRKEHPELALNYAIGSDTNGSVAVTSSNGGVVCISGTGSNCLLINPDGSRAQAGGWGYILGDEGSAWGIAKTGIKICYDHLDNFKKSPHPIEKVWGAAQKFFNVETQQDLLLIYTNFDKSMVAKFCTALAKLAEKNDPLAKYLFWEAGQHLAMFIGAVYPKADPKLTKIKGGLHVNCVGSVWKSWDLLKDGFVNHIEKSTKIDELSLVEITAPSGLGAVFMACDKLNLSLTRNYEDNFKLFYNYKRLA